MHRPNRSPSPGPGRPTSNDGCHVEQKNWDIARRTVGYWRYDTPGEIAVLNQIWPALSPLINLFTPQQKLRTKTRDRRESDQDLRQRPDALPASAQPTPSVLDEVDAHRLAAQLQATNPAAARRQVDRPLQHLAGQGPPQDRHPPRPNRRRLPIQNQDQQAGLRTGQLPMSQRLTPSGHLT